MASAAKPDSPVGLLEEIIQGIDEHNVDSPDHGYNCSCMDKYIRQLRVKLTGLSVNTQGRMQHILRASGRW